MMFWSTKTGISANYSFSSSPTFSAEPWSIYTARPKSGSNSSIPPKVSVFMFDKKQYENYLLNYGIIKSRSSSADKNILEEGYEVLRNQVSNLAKMKHPNILTLIEPLEEHSKNFLFVTEYVTGSLETVFSNPDEEQNFLQGHVKEDVIIHRGIYQMVHALDFIQNRALSVHMDIQPRSVFINKNADWKLSGLGFLVKLPKDTQQAEHFLPQYDPRIPAFMHIDYNYTAPEIVLDNSVSFKSDFFSLGCLIYLLYSGQNLLNTENSSSEYKDEYIKFERKVSTMSWDTVFAKLPVKLRQCIPKLMNRDLYSRYDSITDFLDSDFFKDPMIRTLNFLDDLPTKSNEDKLIFLDGLSELLPKFPNSLLQRKFLSVLLNLINQLCAEKSPNARCISVDFDIIIKIGASLSQLSFQERIYPIISSKIVFPVLLKYANISFIDNLAILKEKIKQQDFLEGVLKPLLTHVLQDMDGDAAVLPQEKILAGMPLILETLDFLTVKNFLLPLISKLFTKTTSLKVKITCVSCFSLLIEKKTIDNYIVCDDILPLFKSMKSRDARILGKSLQLFEIIPTVVTDENVLVEQLLPLMWNYSMAQTLNSKQYSDYTKVINKLSIEIQNNHLSTLQKTTTNEPNNGARSFNRIIEPELETKKIDKEEEIAKNIHAPVMEPTRTISGGNSKSLNSMRMQQEQNKQRSNKPSILTSRTNNSNNSKNNMTPMNLNKQSPLIQSNSKSSSYDTVKTLSSKLPVRDTQATNSFGRTTTNSSYNSVSGSSLSNLDINNNYTSTHMHTTNMVNTNTSILQPQNNINANTYGSNNNSSLPPGFSFALQPNKKPDSRQTSSTMNSNTTTNNNNNNNNNNYNTGSFGDSLI
ncbi:hypothetical protein TBLA_0B05130 [Henningerozyma blattae CBS 6284]|uniref:Protein kinase domain-containing protein n=1 Tax=Henningerozyma blattae (strain ATCC 34711 / CBS 6284 / DSM 70876 / NBRC 10599 / NRRL Y-10934 / UCD 77-7) TaxID=1071380 RepID=I2GYZ4_HENB6|nr:hypothetical protein TBLA_0B05130 [Tetrapisispora blattae CBS 6284]CCH59346.1 hypothetical protein TBLA_0B05130 [Tetrapisispora blattae CBS 6284]